MGTNYIKKARDVRLPVVTDLHVNTFASGITNEEGGYIYNGIIMKYPNGKYYVTQRPTVNVVIDPDTESVTANKGRGVYYWDQVGAGNYMITDYVNTGYVESSDTPDIYMVNDDTVYKTDYGTACTGSSLTSGNTKVYIKELEDKIVFLDAVNNEMFYIDDGTASVLKPMNFAYAAENMTFTAATDTITTTSTLSPLMNAGDKFTVSGTTNYDSTTFTVSSHSGTSIVVTNDIGTDEGPVSTTLTPYPALPQNNSLELADGLVVLDKTMYVLAKDGTIWGSAISDAQDWTDGLNVITAEREEDQGVFIAKHHDNIVVFGKTTIEFFYDAGNPVGSPLATRDDISYNIGCADPYSVWVNGDTIYFLGRDPTGQVQVYLLSSFELSIISTSTLSSYFSSANSYLGSGFTAGGINYYILTTYITAAGEISPYETHVYNSLSKTWTEWEYGDSSLTTEFPIISMTNTSDTGFGQFTTGEVFTINDNFIPSEGGNNISMRIRIDHFDNDSRDWKYAHQLRYVGDSTNNSQTITVKWADDNNTTYSAGRTIDISNSKDKLTRLGRFKSRSHQIEYSGSEQIRIEGLDLDITEGTH